MARTSAAHAAETARRILEVATTHFAEKGYAAVSVDEVARAADVTRGAVYHHYRSKPQLFTAVASAQQQHIAEAIAEATDERDGPDGLRIGSHAFLDAITRGAAARVLLIDGPAVLSWEDWRRLDSDGPTVLLSEGLAEAGVDAALLDALTATLSGAMNELALWLSEHPGDSVARSRAHESLDVLLDAVSRPSQLAQE
ncbi:TetR family transcriptional regulator [Microbacterium sp. AGC85]